MQCGELRGDQRGVALQDIAQLDATVGGYDALDWKLQGPFWCKLLWSLLRLLRLRKLRHLCLGLRQAHPL